jgi:hypothetical protein
VPHTIPLLCEFKLQPYKTNPLSSCNIWHSLDYGWVIFRGTFNKSLASNFCISGISKCYNVL